MAANSETALQTERKNYLSPPSTSFPPCSKQKMMTKRSRLIVLIAALMLATTYFFPLWMISLEAPQYPEGLGMYIWINKITGINKGDVAKINNLNHYIGMKEIKEDSIPELKYMPWIIGALMLWGIVAAIAGRRKVLLSWILIFIAVSIAGLIDFYLWEYDYGHDIDLENAIIKIPGTSFQPPLIGSKQILNFKALSLPATGGIVLGLSLLTAIYVYLKEANLLWKRGAK